VTNLRRSAAVQAAFCDAGKMPALPLRCHYILRTSLSNEAGLAAEAW